ncbi:hypothetical protein Q7C36_018072 [Tachysurus vachellii]|uniref:Endothelial cell-specific chemotaxis regulator n=1 Tax=Tachysurus vachellii TaxID=175792 RepID=A0AA88LZA1_TACVA|nr:endothelial cell-specific chemotaxis regulator [Tachysurus vachellii]KAK2827146.1 hypothetical protein Q7C36_018072 [Tachysurus vachellii]
MTLLLSTFIVLCVSVSLTAVTVSTNTNTTNVTQNQSTGDAAHPTQTPENGLTTLAFGVMSFILILIIVMVILVTVVNFRGWCSNTKEEGVKNYGSVTSEGQVRQAGERESIMLVSMRTLSTDTDTESLRISSIYSTALDDEYQ